MEEHSTRDKAILIGKTMKDMITRPGFMQVISNDIVRHHTLFSLNEQTRGFLLLYMR